jgi:hypothetical protein
VSFTGNSVTFNVTGSPWPGQSSVTVTLQTLCPSNIPTLNEWGMMMFGLLVAGAGLLLFRRR